MYKFSYLFMFNLQDGDVQILFQTTVTTVVSIKENRRVLNSGSRVWRLGSFSVCEDLALIVLKEQVLKMDRKAVTENLLETFHISLVG